MKNLILIAIFSTLLITGCSFKKPNSGVDIKSTPQSKVFINEKEVGSTPYINKQMAAGEYTIKLVSDRGQWTSNKIRIIDNTLFTINRELAENSEDQAGENVSLEKGKGIAVFTTPTQADISLDGQVQDKSPYLIAATSKGVHEILLSKEGYDSRTIKVKTIDGYKVFIEAQLKKTSDLPIPTTSAEPSPLPSSTPSVSSSPTPKPSATEKPTASPKPSAAPKSSPSGSPTSSTSPTGKTVTVVSPGTGWLRVRNKPGVDGQEISLVNDGETFAYEEQLSSGWTLIILSDGTKGYVSSKYVKINK